MYLIEKLRFCPGCGAGGFEASSEKSGRCAHCDLKLYVNVASATGAFLTDPLGRLLLVKRSREPSKGMLGLPGGFVDPGETAEEALSREVREELNLEVTSFEYLCSYPNEYHYAGITYRVLDLFFVCSVQSFEPAEALDEVDELVYVSPADLEGSALAFPSARIAFQALRKRVA